MSSRSMDVIALDARVREQVFESLPNRRRSRIGAAHEDGIH